ncbi:MAG: hypothetical protein WBG57_10335 [Ornithinimicrobium sp.]
MSLPALTAITHRWESAFAGILGRSEDVHVARRCADLAELLGCAASGIGKVAAVSVDLRGLDRSAMATLGDHGVRVLGVFAPGDEAGQRTLQRWGVTASVSADATEDIVHEALATLVSETTGVATTLTRAPRREDEDEDLDAEFEAYLSTSDVADSPVDPSSPHAQSQGETSGSGSVLAVWGPVGGPGRSTVALNVAAEIALAESVLLVDADTYGASLAQMLAILDEAPGVVAAARAADNGSLDAIVLARLARQVSTGWQVLTGLPRADRWPELREYAMADVLSIARQVAAWTVIDLGFCLEQDEEVSFDTLAPRRNGVALRTLEIADHVLLVGSADPIGLQRLVRAHQELRDHSQAPCTVVVNRLRASAVGRDPQRQIDQILARLVGVEDIHTIPEDVEALDAALLAGVSLREIRPGSAARRGLVDVASGVSGGRVPALRAKRTIRSRWGKKAMGLQ